MSHHVYVLKADLVGFRGVNRTIAFRSDQTLVDVHQALQAAFEWDDDHLYSFWLNGKFWSGTADEYTHPWHASEPNPLAMFTLDPDPQSADIRLDRLELVKGQRIAYVFDFGDEWRVRLTLRQITADDGRPYPLLLTAAGEAPPQYQDYDEIEDVA